MVKRQVQFKASDEEIEKYKALGHQNPHRAGRDYKDPRKAIEAKMKWYQHKTKIPQEQAEKFGSPRARYWREEADRKGQLFANPVAHQGGGNTGLRKPKLITAEYRGNHPAMISLSKRLSQEKYASNIGPKTIKETNPKGKNPGDHWDIPTKGFKGAHFAVYPEKLCEMPILAGSKPGDVILDPFAGASTTGVVALKHGRKFIGIDLNEDYLKISKKRLQNTIGSLLS